MTASALPTTMCTCAASGKAISSVLLFVRPSVTTKITRSATAKQLVSITNLSKSLKKLASFASNYLARPTSITDAAFLLATPRVYKRREREYRTLYCRVKIPFAKYKGQTGQNYKHYAQLL